MQISIIAAIGKNNELGKDGKLIWHLKGDLKFFKDVTMGHSIVMGRKTFESLPKVLPGRKNIVISKTLHNKEIELYKSVKEFIQENRHSNEEFFIIGGASIYEQFIPLTSKMYLTHIEAEDKKADVYFPSFDFKDWDCNIISNNIDNNIQYRHVLYKKK